MHGVLIKILTLLCGKVKKYKDKCLYLTAISVQFRQKTHDAI